MVIKGENGVMKLVNVVAFLLTVSVAQAEPDLAGFWQHEREPVWIEMIPAAGEGVVVRNDNQPERVGFKVVKGLEAGSQPAIWSGQVFAARLGEYRDAIITLEPDDRLAFTVKVGMMKRTVEWRRVPEVPSATDDE
jgi:hypothetical protein